ncbi:hypothetical protein ACFQ0B_46775 [Nonomuraea thailandensis]
MTPPPTTAPTTEPTTEPTKRHYKWATVGDSYTSGEGASHGSVYVGYPTESFKHQSGYAPAHLAWAYLQQGRYPIGSYTILPQEIRSTWGGDEMHFNASSGAETKHLKQQHCENKSCSVVRNPPQLDGVPADTDIVYFGLGGNDAGFGSLLSSAIASHYVGWLKEDIHDPSMPNYQARDVELEVKRLLKRIPQVSANVEQALVDTHAKAGKAAIVVALYPLAVKASGNAGITQITGAALDQMYPFAAAVNQAIKDAVANFRARYPSVKLHVFDPNTAGPNGTSVVAGHELGQAAPYFNGLKVRKELIGNTKAFKIAQESFHPNEPGAVAIGKALATFMAGAFPDLFPNGPDFTNVHTNPIADAQDPEAEREFEEWALAHPELMCEGAEIDSICHYIRPNGETKFPVTIVTDPIPFPAIPGRTWSAVASAVVVATEAATAGFRPLTRTRPGSRASTAVRAPSRAAAPAVVRVVAQAEAPAAAQAEAPAAALAVALAAVPAVALAAVPAATVAARATAAAPVPVPAAAPAAPAAPAGPRTRPPATRASPSRWSRAAVAPCRSRRPW